MGAINVTILYPFFLNIIILLSTVNNTYLDKNITYINT